MIQGTWEKLAVEVNTGRVETSELRGLAELTRRFPSYRPLLIDDDAAHATADRVGIAFLPWRKFLLEGQKSLP